VTTEEEVEIVGQQENQKCTQRFVLNVRQRPKCPSSLRTVNQYDVENVLDQQVRNEGEKVGVKEAVNTKAPKPTLTLTCKTDSRDLKNN